jgi:hypothetical protein
MASNRRRVEFPRDADADGQARTGEAQAIADLLVTTFQTAGSALPWLTDHYDCGPPTPAELSALRAGRTVLVA